ncbi:putative arid-like protein [Erysiphe neolycopersici]|uniref:Putative arid-like protein n=1 Tax=Erysiphe neolycopersici TaxID=212602 RepID=A0A420HLM5_9PEZI|nr:putative arid-like protein [Erysiphe neolycopersici]
MSQNNRHTFRSWRDRWLNYLSPDRTKISAGIDCRIQVKSCTNMEKTVTFTGSKNSGITAEINLESHKNIRKNNINDFKPNFNSQDQSDNIPKKSTFTESETNQLFDAYSEIIRVTEEKSSEAWTSWAKEVGTEEWKFHFYEVVKPRQDALIAENLRMRKKRVTTELTKDQDESQGLILFSTDDTFEKLDSQARSPQSLQSHDLAVRNSFEFLEDTTSILESNILFTDPMTHNEYLFKQGLQALADELELDINFSPEICGRKISLMKLWKTVWSPQFGGSREMKCNEYWQKLAESFDFIGHNTLAAKELKDCYGEILAEFEYLRHEFLIEKPLSRRQKKALIENLPLDTSENSSEGSIDSESMDSVVCETQSICNDSIDLDSLQTPAEPHESVKKRGIDHDSSPKTFIPNKRPRISNGKDRILEIPSTPESIINFHKNPNLAQSNSLERVSTSKKFDEIDALSPSPNRRSDSRQSNSVSTQVMDLENQINYFTELSQQAHPISKLEEPNTVEDKKEFRCLRRRNENKPSTTHFSRAKSKNIVYLIDNGLPLQESLVSNTSEETISCSNVSECELGENSVCPKENEKMIVNQIMPLSSQWEDNESQIHQGNTKLDEFVEIQTNLGFSLETIVRALESTSMIIGPGSNIDAVLNTIKETGYIPEDLPGVWTTSDDKILKQAVKSLSPCPSYDNSEGMELLIRKHGKINVQFRKDYWKYVECVNQEQVMTMDDGS